MAWDNFKTSLNYHKPQRNVKVKTFLLPTRGVFGEARRVVTKNRE